MTFLLCRNRVADYSKWKGVFDSHAGAHREAGLRLLSLWRSVEEPDNVFFLFEVADPRKARKFMADPAAAEAGAAAGVVDGEYHFLESESTRPSSGGTSSRRSHWDRVYSKKASDGVSWYQPHLRRSLELISEADLPRTAPILDVGGGTSTLVDDLLDQGFEDVAVLDISPVALQSARKRLGERSNRVTWIEADVTSSALQEHRFQLWHDRAVFHFLTELRDRDAYIANLVNALAPGGHLVVATFALTGPETCSGLDVVRYSPESIHKELGNDFSLVRSQTDAHITPSGSRQDFLFCHFRFKD